MKSVRYIKVVVFLVIISLFSCELHVKISDYEEDMEQLNLVFSGKCLKEKFEIDSIKSYMTYEDENKFVNLTFDIPDEYENKSFKLIQCLGSQSDEFYSFMSNKMAVFLYMNTNSLRYEIPVDVNELVSYRAFVNCLSEQKSVEDCSNKFGVDINQFYFLNNKK